MEKGSCGLADGEPLRTQKVPAHVRGSYSRLSKRTPGRPFQGTRDDRRSETWHSSKELNNTVAVLLSGAPVDSLIQIFSKETE